MAEPAPRSPLSQQEAIALGVAALGHVALIAALVVLKPADPPPPPPGRMAVSLTNETGLVSAAPDPQPDAALDAGPELGEIAPPPEPEPILEAKAEAIPPPIPRAQAKPLPRPPLPRPQIRPLTPQAKPAVRPPLNRPPNTRPPRAGTRPGSTSFDNAFRDGIPGGNNKGPGKNPPAEVTGAQRNSWTSLIGSRVRGPWNACKVTGLDIEQLYVDISFVLATDGTILSIGEPVVGGVTPANRTQVAPFKACAVRAIKLAAPFTGLPPQFYNDWKSRKLRLRKREQ